MTQKPSRQRIESIRAGLHAAAGDPGAALDLRWAAAVLGGAQPPPPAALRPEVVDVLVDELVDAARSETLAWLAAAEEPAVAKPARRGVHRLRSRGVAVDVPLRQAARREPAPATASGDESLITVYDRRAERLVWLVDGAAKGLLMAQARISARYGLLECEIGTIARKAYRRLRDELQQRIVGAPVSARVAHWLIADAARRAEREGRSLPDEYLRHARDLGPAPTGEHPAATLGAADAGEAELLALVERPELAGWLPEQGPLRQLALRYQEVATSQLFVNEAQRAEQVEHALTHWLAEYYTPQRLRSEQQLLLDTAHVVAVRGEQRTAALLAAARALYDLPAGERDAHPFVRRLVERVLPPPRGGGGEPRPEKRSSGGLILP